MDNLNLIQTLIDSFSPQVLTNVLRHIAPGFRPVKASLDQFIAEAHPFDKAEQLGIIELPKTSTVLIVTVNVENELTVRSSKRKQYELAKRILKDGNHNAGIFAFYDKAGRFRLSLVTITYHGTRRQFSAFRRYTFYVDPTLPNKTFIQQFRKTDFSSLNGILATFSLEAVSDQFYKEFKPHFDALAEAVQGTDDESLKQDFALLFVIRTIFLGFVQKRGWLGKNPRFLQDFWAEYQRSDSAGLFYRDWLAPLFFEALSSPPGRKVAYMRAPFSEETQQALQMSPYLNGELFKRKRGVDDQGLWIPDELIGEFFDFLFQYNFTVEENKLYDEELELNPEFLGIIFERLTNMDQGAVYTPRVEVDLMSRLALVKWLERTTNISQTALYQLFFHEVGTEIENEDGPRTDRLSPEEIRTLVERLESVTVCDPAAGSGAFEVGMLQVLDETLEHLYSLPETPDDIRAKTPTTFERKKAIIARSLYGVEVKRWAVWINHLRLWLTLFVDMPDEFKESYEPLLPNLTFKVRVGDSLVQRIGNKSFPVHGHADLPPEVKRKITQLKQKKRDFFYNRLNDYRPIEQQELNVFKAILDAEIDERRREIRRLKTIIETRNLFEDAQPTEKEKQATQANKARITELRAEIADLEIQKHFLKDERPFIWSIEFAEIFFDRGGFDIIIGNPPYVRHEEIADPNGRLSPKEYKNALMEMVRLDFPEYFAKSPIKTDQFKKGRKPSGRSDLYTYFYIRSLRLLNQKGVHVFICSNSWLDVGYGAWLQEFFLRKAPLYLVIDNHARRSFARADINTIIAVAGAPCKTKLISSNVVRFLAFKKPFEESVHADNLITIEQADRILKADDLRVFSISVEELLKEGSEPTELGSGQYVGDKWGGKYLRAPDVFFTILEKGKGKLVKLGEIAEVRFGIKTGANDFFYLESLGHGSRSGFLRVRNSAGWEGEIEEEFLKPVIKSPRESHTIVVDSGKLKYCIFMCHKSIDELRGTKALDYIEWGNIQGYPQRTTLNSRRKWWDLGERKPGLYLWPMIHNDRHAVFLNSSKVQVDHNLFEITPLQQDQIIATLFSIFSVIVRELYGRSNLGEGALKTEGIDIRQFPAIAVGNGENYIKRLSDVVIADVFTECGINPNSDIPIAEQEPKPLPDRKALDDVVFDALELTEEERKEVYRAVCQLVWERISKARSFSKKK